MAKLYGCSRCKQKFPKAKLIRHQGAQYCRECARGVWGITIRPSKDGLVLERLKELENEITGGQKT